MPLCIFETIASIFETVAGNRVTIDVLAGRPLGPLTLLIIGSITMPHTQTNIHRKRNTLFDDFCRKERFFQKSFLKLIINDDQGYL